MVVTSDLLSSITTPVEERPQLSGLSMLSPGYGYTDFAGITFLKNRKATKKVKEQIAAIIATNLSKMHLVSYNSYAPTMKNSNIEW